MMKKIELTQDQVALVDDADFDDLNQWKWHAHKDPARAIGYQFDAQRKVVIAGERAVLYMHRYLMNPTSDQQVDHIDGNPLNNQRSNLRLCTNQQNNRNVGKRRDNTSGHKGVTWHVKNAKWRSRIQIDGKETHLGYFDDISDAAQAYKDAAAKYFGDFARNEK